MDRRAFLKTAAITTGAVAATASSTAAIAGESVSAEEVDTRTYANERYGDTKLVDTRVIWQVPTTEKLVALTFDDGPMPRNTAAILDILAEKKVRATFMVVGKRVEQNPDLFRRELAAKHEIGNHTWAHKVLPLVSRDEVVRQMRRTDEIVERLSGRRPTVFRPPRGCISGDCLTEASRLEYDVLMWSLQLHEDAFDAPGNVKYIADNLRPGAVVLAHDYGDASRRVGLAALPDLIDTVRDRGYTFVTASELIEAGRTGR